MVRFSDLKDDQKESRNKPQQKSERGGVQQSHLSFSQLDKEKEVFVSGGIDQGEKINDEIRLALFEKASSYLEEVFDAVRNRHRFSLEPAIQIIQKVIDGQSPNDPLFIKAIHIDEPDNFIINNCVNVTIFAIKMADDLGFSKDRQAEIGLAAMLHEVGMGVIPEKLIYKKEELTDREFEIFKKRTEYAYKILRIFGEEYGYLAETAIQVHERIDGSGYPMSLMGDEICEYAQIVGLVDIYETLTHTRPHREKSSHFSAIKEIIATGKCRFHKRYLKALLNVFSTFPLSTYVKLNSNAIGKVIETYPGQPMRPKLQIMFDSQGRKVLTERIVDLKENSILYVVDAISEEDLQIIFEGAEPDAIYSKPQVVKGGIPFYEEIEPAGDEDKKDEPFYIKGLPEKEEADKELVSLEELQEDTAQISEKTVGKKLRSRRRKPGRLKYVLIFVAVILGALGIAWQLGFMASPQGKGDQLKPGDRKGGGLPEQNRQIPAVEIREAGKDGSTDHKDQIRQNSKGLSKNAQQAKPEKTGLASESMPPSRDTGKEDKKIEAEKGVETVTPPDRPAYPFSIRFASFKTRPAAEQSLPGYAAKGLSPYWVKVSLGEQGIWYRVFAGYFENARQAEKVIKEKNLAGAVVKKTLYSAFIGRYSSEATLKEKTGLLLKLGYSPYVIKADKGGGSLYVGAFYTKKGAEDQRSELIASGIQSRVVKR